MRREFRWALAAAAAFAFGLAFEEAYARLAAPYYMAVDRLIATGRSWDIISVAVRPGESNLGAELQLWAFVRRHREDANPAAKVQGRVQVGEVVETPMVFWTLLLMWPAASIRHRLLRVLAGVPIFLVLEGLTTATQLILPMAQASAILAGDANPVTTWLYWSRFLEAGGQFVLAIGAGVMAVSLTRGRESRGAHR